MSQPTKLELIKTITFAIEMGFTNIEQQMIRQLASVYGIVPKVVDIMSYNHCALEAYEDGNSRLKWIKTFKDLTGCTLQEARDESYRRFPKKDY